MKYTILTKGASSVFLNLLFHFLCIYLDIIVILI